METREDLAMGEEMTNEIAISCHAGEEDTRNYFFSLFIKKREREKEKEECKMEEELGAVKAKLDEGQKGTKERGHHSVVRLFGDHLCFQWAYP